MSILDTFTILFQADASSLQKGLDASRKEADKLNHELDKTDQNATKVTSALGAALKSMAALAAGFVAVSTAKTFFTDTVANLNGIEDAANKIGDSIGNIDAVGQSVVIMGGDAKSARESMVSMWDSIGTASKNSASDQAQAFAKLGIAIQDTNGKTITATEGMLGLADAVKGMEKEAAISAINSVGIKDEKTIELILKGRQEMERMLAVQKAQSAVTKESVENARKYTEAMNRMEIAGRTVVNSIANALIPVVSAILPVLETVTDAIITGVKWMQDNSQTVIAFFGAIAAAVAIMYLPAMVSAAAATLAATWPIIAAAAVVTALATAFALLYDDIQNFLAGNDSLIGQISEKYPIVGETVKKVAETIGDAWEGLKAIGEGLWEMLQPLGEAIAGAFSAGGDAAMAFFDLFKVIVSKLVNLVSVDLTGSFKFAGDFIAGVMKGITMAVSAAVAFITGAFKVISKVLSGIGSAIKTVSSLIGAGSEGAAADKNAKAGSTAIAGANATPLNNTSSGAIANTKNSVNRETNVQVGQVTVQTQATDAQGIAGDVGGALNGQLSRLDTEFSSGVDR